MASRIVQIEVKMTGTGGYEQEVNKIIDKNNQLTRSAVQGAQNGVREFDRMNVTVRGLTDGFSRLQQAAASVAVVWGTLRVGRELLDTAVSIDRINNTLKAATGSAQAARAEFSFIVDLSEKLGLNIQDTALSFSRLAAATRGTFLEGRQTRELFESVAENLRVLGLSADDANGALRALYQVVSKGKVAAEEIRGQLGERAPGFFEAFARAAGKSTDEFNRLLDQGKVGLDVLPKLSAELKKMAETALPEAMQSLQARLERINNTWFKFQAALKPVIVDIVSFIERNRELIITVGGMVAVIVGSGGLIFAFTKLGAALLAIIANPAGLVALLALVGLGAAAFFTLKSRIQEFTETLTKAGAESGLKRLTDELIELDRAQRKFFEDRASGKRIPASEFARATERQARIDELERQIERQSKIVRQFEEFDARINNIGGSPKLPVDPKAAQEAANFIQELQKRISELRNEIANPTHDANIKLMQDFEELEQRASKFSDPGIKKLVENIKAYTLAQIDRNKQDEEHKQLLEQITIQTKLLNDVEKATEENQAKARRDMEANLEAAEKLLNHEVERLRVLGLTDAAEKLSLQNTIKNLEERKRALQILVEQGGKLNGGETIAIDRQIELTRLKLEQFGKVTINIGQTIAQSVGDAFQGVILGTSKLADVGKNLFAALLRDIGQFFTQSLLKKAGFENLLLSNVNGFVPQLTGAIGAAGALPGSQAGYGSAPAGVAGPSLPGGGFFSSPLNFLSNILPRGSSLSGIAAAGLGGFGLSKALGGSGLQHGLSTLGSIGGHLLAGTAIGTSITTSIANALAGIVGTQLAGQLANFVLPGIGSIIGFLIGGLFQDIPNPSVWVKTIIKFYYDALTTSFNAFTKATIVRFEDIKGSRAQQVLEEHQSIMDGVAEQFVSILNQFPTAVHGPMVEALEAANAMLDALFGGKKYSEGGSRSIQQELDDLRNREAPIGFFLALRETIGIGLRETLARSGFDFSEIINQQFARTPSSTLSLFGSRGILQGPGILPPSNKDDIPAFFDALSRFANFTGTLSGISPRGITPFVTESDMARLEAELQKVLESSGDKFAGSVDKFLENVKPLSDFLQKSVTEASNLFGRGVIAALEAATGSQAVSNFFNVIGQGTKDIIFNGIAEAFIASAQFTDLLAPIQQTIREFTQEALSTGEVPDVNEFRNSLLPGIEQIASRLELLRPLVELLQELGLDVREALGILTNGNVGGRIINITIPNLPASASAQDVAREIERAMRGEAPPAS